MRTGKWYLRYIEFDELEHYEDDALREEKVGLKATDKKAAVMEATNLWKQRLAKGSYRGWDSNIYPNFPRAVYEIQIQ